MLEHQHRFRLQRMAAVFGVSRSGYYQWRRTGAEPGEKALRRAALDQKISQAFTQGKQRDGARRIQVELVRISANPISDSGVIRSPANRSFS